jgi:hypothetical protein
VVALIPGLSEPQAHTPAKRHDPPGLCKVHLCVTSESFYKTRNYSESDSLQPPSSQEKEVYTAPSCNSKCHQAQGIGPDYTAYASVSGVFKLRVESSKVMCSGKKITGHVKNSLLL